MRNGINLKLASYRLLLIALLSALSNTAYTASFNCAKASTTNEKKICSEPLLSSMDDSYAAMYLHMLKKTKHDPAKYNTVKSAAVTAFRSREKNCSDVHCLRRWYQAGRERLSQQLWELEPALLQKKITPKLLYEQLNLLTFNNMEHQKLRYHNKRYLADLYPISSVTFESDQLHIEHENSIWRIRIEDEDTIEIFNRITNASYNSTHSETLYYDPVIKEFRAGMPSHCNLYSEGSKPEYSNQNDLEHLSYGEIELFSVVPALSIPIFNKPNGDKNGSLNIDVKREIENHTLETITDPIIRICGKHFETLAKPAYVIRLKYDIGLLYFDRKANWINLSFESNVPAWIAISDLPQSMQKHIKSRESVVMQGSSILVRSTHRLRAEPNTNSDIVRVLNRSDSGENAAIEPIEINGDWMKVMHITPNPMFETEPTLYEKNIGWIKWREKPGVEYVDVDYAIGL